VDSFAFVLLFLVLLFSGWSILQNTMHVVRIQKREATPTPAEPFLPGTPWGL